MMIGRSKGERALGAARARSHLDAGLCWRRAGGTCGGWVCGGSAAQELEGCGGVPAGGGGRAGARRAAAGMGSSFVRCDTISI